MRVPVAVVQDDRISCGEVDALTPSPRAEKENGEIGSSVEVLDLLPSVILFDGAVDTAGVPAVQDGGPVFEDIKLGFELREDKNFVVG